ncbi:MAG: 5'-nucleotidase C-terminal domain-containing protein [Cyanobacteria bacterium]|nr:5'-nucleotidase C-terminal domain-containing protein [Cyanobacteriota bacterium]MDW8200587.1 5'-nucleotidase C-terminal domain-containing protein [Cyanobacteriota bacterium SKYGB_h_bin112]
MTTRVQILYASDFEAGVPAAGTSPQTSDAVRFSAVWNRLRTNTNPATFGIDQATLNNTILLLGGDNYIPSPFFNASSDLSLNGVGGLGTSTAPTLGRGDVSIMNALGVQASVLGNHEFDLGMRQVRDIIRPGGGSNGTQFPYLSVNLDFVPEIATGNSIANSDLGGGNPGATGQTTAEYQNITTKLAKSTIIHLNGPNGVRDTPAQAGANAPLPALVGDDDRVGVIGVTTPTLRSISSPGATGVNPSNPTDFAALATIIQAQVDALTAAGINKIILLGHMQQFQLEADELAPRLRNVDVIFAAGSHTQFFDSTDVRRPSDVGLNNPSFPLIRTDRDGQPVYIVSSASNYQYVNRFVVEFDAAGRIIPSSLSPNINGAYATNQAGVDRVYGTTNFNAAGDLSAQIGAALNTEHQKIVAITSGIRTVIQSKDGTFFGNTSEFLNGTRFDVRNEETNFGNLTADANAWYGRLVDNRVLVSLKNGGGIRDNIGVVDSAGSAGATDPSGIRRLPPQPNELVPNKPVGNISTLDIENSLRFNNGLTLLTLTAKQIKDLFEASVSNVDPGETNGNFPQVGGVSFSWDRNGTAIVFDNNGNVTTEGTKIKNLVLINDDGSTRDTIVQNGNVVGDPNRLIRIITLNFLAGDPTAAVPTLTDSVYPLARWTKANPTRVNRVDLLGEPDTNGNGILDPGEDLNLNGVRDPALNIPVNRATFAVAGTEQDAFAEYMREFFTRTPFDVPDTPASRDTRIQNLAQRTDTVGRGAAFLNGKELTLNGAPRLRVTLTGQSGTTVNEVGVFVLQQGETLSSVTAANALRRGQVIFSAIANSPTGFNQANLERIVTGLGLGARLGFFIVQNGTVDGVLAGQIPISRVTIGENAFTISQSGTSFSVNLGTVQLNITPTSGPAAIATSLQGDQQGEVLDLRSLTGNVTATFTVNREAAFNNLVGFYRVANETGAINDNGTLINPGSAGYAAAAMRARVTGVDLSVPNQGTSTFTATIAAGSILAPFIITNGGTVAQAQTNTLPAGTAIYFPYLAANPGRVDHVRLLGNNTFGFEDLPGGGDVDYNDVIVRVTIT